MTHVNNLAGCEGDSQYRQRILVTGGAGFIGSHVVVTLVERYPDYYIINLDKLEYCASLRNLDQIQHRKNYKFIQGDICVPVFMRSIFQREKIDVVLHFAAQSHVGLSFWNSLNFTRTNVYGTHVLINAAYEAGVKRFVHISTDEVYGGNSTVKLKEDASLKPTNPYAASKAAAESIVQCYWEAFKFPVIIARANNVYGPRQYPEKVIPKFISLLENHKKCYIHGDGSVTRNFLYVADAVEAFDKILHQGEPGEVYNVGTDFRLSVIELAKYLIKKLTNARTDEDVAKFIEYVADRPYNDLRYLMDSSKLHDLGWAPKVEWEEGIEKTISWYSQNKEANIWTGVEEALMPHPVGAFCPTTPYHDDSNMVIPHPVTMATGDVVKEDGDVVGLPMLPEYHDVE